MAHSTSLSQVADQSRAMIKRWEAGVSHVTLDPEGPGFVRLHLVPPKPGLDPSTPWLLFINGWYILPIGPSWAYLLKAFMNSLNKLATQGDEISNPLLEKILKETVRQMSLIYPKEPSDTFLKDLNELVDLCRRIASGKPVPEVGTAMTLREYAPFLRAPHRMDLIISPMVKNGQWACPLHCKGCYAAGQPAMTITQELSTSQWKQIINRCRELGIPQLTFTGGEPTQRLDLVELVRHASWFVTRLNTNGVNMTPELAKALFQASLDSIQITLLSYEPTIHDDLVGRPGAWQRTVAGIRNAKEAGLNVSINTPLVRKNADYSTTLEYIRSLGIRFVSCSGLIPTGGAPAEIHNGEALSNTEMFETVKRAVETAKRLGMEIMFTSPGWLTADQLQNLGLEDPVCGACLSNMAIMPNGAVTICQSSLSDPMGLGNILETPWEQIWDNPLCEKMRFTASVGCPLEEV